MPGIPYVELAVAGGVVLLIAGLLFAAYRWGRNAERAATLKGVSDMERKVSDAVAEARRAPVRVHDANWLRGTRLGTPPRDPRPSDPPRPDEPVP